MTYYVVKGYRLAEVGLNIVHIVDDNCNEFTAIETTRKGVNSGYYTDNELHLINIKPYHRSEWETLIRELEYPIIPIQI